MDASLKSQNSFGLPDSYINLETTVEFNFVVQLITLCCTHLYSTLSVLLLRKFRYTLPLSLTTIPYLKRILLDDIRYNAIVSVNLL